MGFLPRLGIPKLMEHGPSSQSISNQPTQEFGIGLLYFGHLHRQVAGKADIQLNGTRLPSSWLVQWIAGFDVSKQWRHAAP